MCGDRRGGAADSSGKLTMYYLPWAVFVLFLVEIPPSFRVCSIQYEMPVPQGVCRAVVE